MGKMADLQSEFNTFHDRITLTSSKKDSLRKARNALRDKIRKHFRGSYAQRANSDGAGI